MFWHRFVKARVYLRVTAALLTKLMWSKGSSALHGYAWTCKSRSAREQRSTSRSLCETCSKGSSLASTGSSLVENGLFNVCRQSLLKVDMLGALMLCLCHRCGKRGYGTTDCLAVGRNVSRAKSYAGGRAPSPPGSFR